MYFADYLVEYSDKFEEWQVRKDNGDNTTSFIKGGFSSARDANEWLEEKRNTMEKIFQ